MSFRPCKFWLINVICFLQILSYQWYVYLFFFAVKVDMLILCLFYRFCLINVMPFLFRSLWHSNAIQNPNLPFWTTVSHHEFFPKHYLLKHIQSWNGKMSKHLKTSCLFESFKYSHVFSVYDSSEKWKSRKRIQLLSFQSLVTWPLLIIRRL